MKQSFNRTSKPFGKTPIKSVTRQVRRRPVQARSMATVEALLDAAALILSKENCLHFTTNEISKVAGVGIGSFYEYFPDKNELLARLTDRFAAEIKDRTLRTIHARKEDGIEAALTAGLDGLIECFQSRTVLHRRLLEHAPYLPRTNPLTLIEEPIREALVHMLRANADEIIVEDYEVAAINISRICRAMVEGAHSDPFMPLDLATVRSELLVILRRYLTARP